LVFGLGLPLGLSGRRLSGSRILSGRRCLCGSGRSARLGRLPGVADLLGLAYGRDLRGRLLTARIGGVSLRRLRLRLMSLRRLSLTRLSFGLRNGRFELAVGYRGVGGISRRAIELREPFSGLGRLVAQLFEPALSDQLRLMGGVTALDDGDVTRSLVFRIDQHRGETLSLYLSSALTARVNMA
jgi:hypothetical protein